jgi:hypothetical protein
VEDLCPTCGRSLDSHDRDVRFRLPDPVLGATTEQLDQAWQSDPDANRAVMMQVPGHGAFVRALLPVHLTGGYTLTFGVWIAVHPDDLQRAYRVWWSPAYPELKLEGSLANAIQPWGLLAAPVSTEVRDPDETPYCASSADPTLQRVLHDDWPHEEVLSALPRDIGAIWPDAGVTAEPF